MGADNSKPVVKKEAEKKGRSAYHDVKDPKYVENPSPSVVLPTAAAPVVVPSSASSSSSESVSSESLKTCPMSSSSDSSSSSTSSDEDEKRTDKKGTKSAQKKKKKKKKESKKEKPFHRKSLPLKALDGLSQKEKVKKSEEMLGFWWKHPPASWSKVSDVTSIITEKPMNDGQISDEVLREVNFESDKKVFEVPLDHCNIRMHKSRNTRNCPDPWRKHGAHVKLCEIGGTIPENKGKNAKVITVKKGTPPPAAPKTKPLATLEDYLKVAKK